MKITWYFQTSLNHYNLKKELDLTQMSVIKRAIIQSIVSQNPEALKNFAQ